VWMKKKNETAGYRTMRSMRGSVPEGTGK